MTYKAFLIKYAEIAIKGKNRYLFEDALVSQMNHALKKVDGRSMIRKGGRAESMQRWRANTITMELWRHCSMCLASWESVRSYCWRTRALMRWRGSHPLYRRGIPGQAFYVQGQCAPREKELPVGVDGDQCPDGRADLRGVPETSVDVHKPQVMFNIEIRNQINVYSTVIPGPGGMPVGTNGKAMLLLSGGIDSPVAGYMIAKRGVYHRCDLFSCAALYVGARQAEGRGSGKDHFQIYRTDQSACGQFYGYPVIYLRTVSA